MGNAGRHGETWVAIPETRQRLPRTVPSRVGGEGVEFGWTASTTIYLASKKLAFNLPFHMSQIRNGRNATGQFVLNHPGFGRDGDHREVFVSRLGIPLHHTGATILKPAGEAAFLRFCEVGVMPLSSFWNAPTETFK
jgi:hypothetical protein